MTSAHIALLLTYIAHLQRERDGYRAVADMSKQERERWYKAYQREILKGGAEQ